MLFVCAMRAYEVVLVEKFAPTILEVSHLSHDDHYNTCGFDMHSLPGQYRTTSSIWSCYGRSSSFVLCDTKTEPYRMLYSSDDAPAGQL